MLIDDFLKEQILEYMKKYPGVYIECNKEDVDKLNQNILTRNICICTLDNLMFLCEDMKETLKKNTIYDKYNYSLAESIYSIIPKNPEREKYPDVLVCSIPDFSEIDDKTLQIYLYNMFKAYNLYRNVLINQSYTSRAERILKSIKSIDGEFPVSRLQGIVLKDLYNDLKRELEKGQNVDISVLKANIELFGDIAVNIWNRYLDQGRCLLVHNYSRGEIENFIPSKFLSTSLISDRYMALFQEKRGNNYGLIVRPKKIICADSRDVFTHNRSDDLSVDMFGLGQFPPLLFPWEIEKEAIDNALSMNGEILNYDNGYILPEIVLSDYDVVGAYYRTGSPNDVDSNYDRAVELANKYDVEVIKLDLNAERIKEGLKPIR